jgi:outer membrane protein
MGISSRGIWAIGLSSLGVALAVGSSSGQQTGRASEDSAVRGVANQGTSVPPRPPVPVAPIIGTVDLELVFKNYEKVKNANKEFNGAMLARKNELMKLMSEAQAEAEMMNKFTPNSEDYKKHEGRVTELKAKHEAGRESAEREFALRQAESMATLYKEVQAMVARVAKWHNMNYVVKVSNQPISGSDPNSVMNAISSTMVYCDPRNDITNDVIHNLNRMYRQFQEGQTNPAAATKPLNRGSGSAAGSAARPDAN